MARAKRSVGDLRRNGPLGTLRSTVKKLTPKKQMIRWTEKNSGESFDALNLREAKAYLREALNDGEEVAYRLVGSDGSYQEGTIIG